MEAEIKKLKDAESKKEKEIETAKSKDEAKFKQEQQQAKDTIRKLTSELVALKNEKLKLSKQATDSQNMV